MFHRGIQEIFVLPMIQLPERALKLVIDDSIVVTWKHTGGGEEYYQRYRYVVETLGLRIKEHDP